MQIKFLGNWSSHLEAGKRNVSMIIDKKFVLDFGPHTLESLLENHIDPCSVNEVLISHMHLDHFGGIPEFLWYRTINHSREPVTIIGPNGIKSATEKILELYNTPFNGRFRVNSTFKESSGEKKPYDMKTEYIEKYKYDYIEAFKGNHIIDDNIYRIEYKGTVITYSGDTAFTENAIKAAEDADVLFHEMTYADDNAETAAFWKHSTYSSAMNVFNESKAKMMIPVHLTTETFNFLNARKNERVRLPIADLEF